jgi:hypothetical protein
MQILHILHKFAILLGNAHINCLNGTKNDEIHLCDVKKGIF